MNRPSNKRLLLIPTNARSRNPPWTLPALGSEVQAKTKKEGRVKETFLWTGPRPCKEPDVDGEDITKETADVRSGGAHIKSRVRERRGTQTCRHLGR